MGGKHFRLGKVATVVCFPKPDDIAEKSTLIHRERSGHACKSSKDADHHPIFRNHSSQFQKAVKTYSSTEPQRRISLSSPFRTYQSPAAQKLRRDSLFRSVDEGNICVQESGADDLLEFSSDFHSCSATPLNKRRSSATRKFLASDSPDYYSLRGTPVNCRGSRKFSAPFARNIVSSPGQVQQYRARDPSTQHEGLNYARFHHSGKKKIVEDRPDHTGAVASKSFEDGEKNRCSRWKVLASVNNETMRRKLVKLKKSKGGRKMKLLTSAIADSTACMPALQLLKSTCFLPQKLKNRSSESRFLQQSGEEWSFSPASVDASAETVAPCSWDKDLASFASESSPFLQFYQERSLNMGRGLNVRSNNLFEQEAGDATPFRSIRQMSPSPSLTPSPMQTSQSALITGFDEEVASLLTQPIISNKPQKPRGVMVRLRRRKKLCAGKLKLKASRRKAELLRDDEEEELPLISSTENLESISKRWIIPPPRTCKTESEVKQQCPPPDSTSLPMARSAHSAKLSAHPSPDHSQGSFKPTDLEEFSSSCSRNEIIPAPSPELQSKLSRLRESVAVVKRSYDPFHDFRDSMVEMIHKKNLQKAEELEELLKYYLSLNAPVYQDLIITVFQDICDELFKT